MTSSSFLPTFFYAAAMSIGERQHFPALVFIDAESRKTIRINWDVETAESYEARNSAMVTAGQFFMTLIQEEPNRDPLQDAQALLASLTSEWS